MAQNDYPENLRYTAEHEWVRPGSDAVRVGITGYAQEALGDIVFISLPDDGTRVKAGQPCGEVESTKSVSEIYAPVTGTVTARNPALEEAPELANADPYGEGWMFEVRPDDPGEVEGLLSAEEYQAGLG